MKPDVFRIGGPRWARRAAINTSRDDRVPEHAVRVLIPRRYSRPARIVGYRLENSDIVRHCSTRSVLLDVAIVTRAPFALTPPLAFKSDLNRLVWLRLICDQK
jgi:hypothetical protein